MHKQVLVKNSWTEQRRPDIQLMALADIMRASADSSRHQLLADLDIPSLLKTILKSAMMDPVLEDDLRERQAEIDALWEKRKSRMLDYLEKKELDRKTHLQVALAVDVVVVDVRRRCGVCGVL